MKKLLISIFICCIANAASAQIREGNFLLGTSVNFQNVAGVHFTGLSMDMGTAFTDNFQGGLSFGYGWAMAKAQNATPFSTERKIKVMDAYSAGVYLRPYLINSRWIGLFLDFALNYEADKYTNPANTINSLGLIISPGINVNLSKMVSIILTWGGIRALACLGWWPTV